MEPEHISLSVWVCCTSVSWVCECVDGARTHQSVSLSVLYICQLSVLSVSMEPEHISLSVWVCCTSVSWVCWVCRWSQNTSVCQFECVVHLSVECVECVDGARTHQSVSLSVSYICQLSVWVCRWSQNTSVCQFECVVHLSVECVSVSMEPEHISLSASFILSYSQYFAFRLLCAVCSPCMSSASLSSLASSPCVFLPCLPTYVLPHVFSPRLPPLTAPRVFPCSPLPSRRPQHAGGLRGGAAGAWGEDRGAAREAGRDDGQTKDDRAVALAVPGRGREAWRGQVPPHVSRAPHPAPRTARTPQPVHRDPRPAARGAIISATKREK